MGTTADGSSSPAVDLRDAGSNTRGVGAWLELRTDAGVQVREGTVGGGRAGG